MEEFVNKVQEEVNRFDRDHLRKIQGDMFRCSAKCCDDTKMSQSDLQRCLNNCSEPAVKADKFMQEQMQDLQDRFQRCAMSCGDKLKDKAGFGESVNNAAYKAEMEQCVAKCGEEMTKVLKPLTNKMQEWFNKGMYNK